MDAQGSGSLSAGESSRLYLFDEWEAETDLDIDPFAAATAYLLETERTWVWRRIERFAFLDGRRVAKSLDVELRVPVVPDWPGDELMALPVARPRKRFLRNLNIVDESGTRLTYLTRDANAFVSTRMLLLQARSLLKGVDVPRGVARDFADIAGLRHSHQEHPDENERRKRTDAAIARFRDAVASPDRSVETQVRRTLWADPVMRVQISQLAQRFTLFIPGLGSSGALRTITLSYELDAALDTLRPPAGGTRRNGRFAKAFSLAQWWRTREYFGVITTRGPFSAASYHAELLAPEDLTVVEARLRLQTIHRGAGPERDEDVEELAFDDGTPRVHLFANGRDAPHAREHKVVTGESASTCFLRFHLRLRPGLVVPVVIIAASVVATLTSGMILRLTGHKAESATVAALLVALPASYAASLFPQGHPLMRRLFTRFRSMMVVLTLVAYGAAASIAVDLDRVVRYVLWVACDIVAVWCLVVAVRTLIRSVEPELSG
jgi:hypothetical protein